MSRRLSITESHGAYTKAELDLRAKQEAKVFALGVPATPEYLWNNRPLHAIWKVYVDKLLAKRVLAFSDGEALLELCKAKLHNDGDAMASILDATWKHRTPFPDPKPSSTAFSLPDFIANVRAERASFRDRMREGETVCMDIDGQPYTWPEGDAATVARQYCLEVRQGAIVVGELIQRACDRFLKFLEEGATHGFHFDPVAARNAVTFAKVFCGLDNLLPWQHWVLSSIFAYKKPWGGRLVTEAWVSMGRKNGKTRFASTVGLFMLVADEEKYPEIYAAATAKEQSRIVWRDAKRAVQDNPELAAYVKRFAGELLVKATEGTFKPLASEEKSFLGTRPSGVIADEVAAWTDRLAWDTLIQGQVSKLQPLILAITTAGETKQSFGFEKFSWAEKILRGIVQADHVFAAIYSIDASDSYKDFAALRKANPSLGITINEENLQKQIAALDDNPSAVNNFLQFHANVYPEKALSRAGSITPAKWDACTGFDLIGTSNPLEATLKFLALNKDTPCFCGVDVGLTSDLSALAWLFPKARFSEGAVPLDRPVVIVQGFMPEIGLLEKERAWQVPLSTWVRDGWLELMPGDMADPSLIKKAVYDAHIQLKIREVGFDPWGFSVAAAEMNQGGITCVGVAQTVKELSAPSRELLGAINSGKLVHFGNPYLTWCASNVVFVENEKNSGVKPEKLSYAEKIDAISAIVNGWHRLLAQPRNLANEVYSKRGIVFL
jgi:phage terminase large subunit-like protein